MKKEMEKRAPRLPLLTQTNTRFRTLHVVLGGIHLLQGRNQKGGGLSSSVLRSGEHIAVHQDLWDGLFLDGRRRLESLLVDAHQELALQIVILERVSVRSGNILHAKSQLVVSKWLGNCSSQ